MKKPLAIMKKQTDKTFVRVIPDAFLKQ